MKKNYIRSSIGVAAFSILLIIFLATGLWKNFYFPKTEEHRGTVIITPREGGLTSVTDQSGQMPWDEGRNTRIPMEDGEIVFAVLNSDSEENISEDQFVIFGNTSDAAREIYLTYIGFDEESRRYRRMWNTPIAATRTETITIFSQDIIGDRNNCVIVTGMNNRSEHTMTVLRRNLSAADHAFNKIAELQIDGSIIIQETVRSLAYQQGITRGQSYNIATYGHDNLSNNMLDQIETVYSFNQESGHYQQTAVSRIPGSQVEQRQLREILSGVPGVFENFINDLWYYVSPQGTVDTRQYIYFDPSGREIIFYGDEAQQVFNWHNSSYTRYGLYIRSQNISISTLLRFIDIELESLDSIKLRVIEDVQLKISVSTSWDGSYRRAGAVALKESASSVRPAVNAVYDSSLGKIQFQNTGDYTINSGNTIRKGRYVFYKVDNNELLEFRSGEKSENENRMIYKVEKVGSSSLSLSRVRLGTAGIQDLFETAIILTPVE
jgi:hypothetical protein